MAYLLSAVIGILGGLVSGLFGVGGGIIFVPLLVLMRNFDSHLAIGTSLAVVVPTTAIGAWRNFKAGTIDWKTFGLIVVFAMIGAWVGSGISLKLDMSLLRRLYGVFLLIVSLKMFFPN